MTCASDHWSGPGRPIEHRTARTDLLAVARRAEPSLQPGELLGEHVQDGLPGHVAVALKGQDHQARRSAIAADGLEEPFGLDREGTRVGIVRPVYEQQRSADPVRVPERGDL